MVWTTSWEGPSIGYACSEDLVDWPGQKGLRPVAHGPTTRNCRAPELTYGPKNNQFMIYWPTAMPGRYPETHSSNIHGRNHRFYYTLTQDFVTFSPTQLLYDPGFSSIDASIYRDGKRWTLFLEMKNGIRKCKNNLKYAFSLWLTVPYAPASPPFTHQWVEGPTALQIDGRWRVYNDEYPRTEGGLFRIRAMESKNLKQWKDISDPMQIPESMRQGTVFKVDDQVIEGIKAVGKW